MSAKKIWSCRFKNKLALPAKLLTLYLLVGVVAIPAVTGYPFLGIKNIFLGREYSPLPFLFSLIAAICIYAPYIYFSQKFISAKSNVILIYVYFFLNLAATTAYLWSHTENGWQPMIIYMALMFYPNKYAFISNVMLLVYAFRSAGAATSSATAKAGQKVRISLAFVYLCCAAAVPYALKYQKISFLEKAPAKQGLPFSCAVETNILQTKKCIEDTIEQRNNGLGKKWERLVKKILYPGRKEYRNNFNKNFIEKETREASPFNSIKECYRQDSCIKDSPAVSARRVLKYDSFDGIYIWVDSSYYATREDKNFYLDVRDDRIYSLGEIKQYPESRATAKKDVLIIKRNSQEEILVAGSEYIPLTDDNFFIVISISRFGGQQTNRSGEVVLQYQEGYKFYTWCHGHECYNQNLEISADRRENPSVIYVLWGNRTFKIENVEL